MEYDVDLTDRAVRDLEQLFLEKNAFESVGAARWFNGLERAVYSLQELPRRGVAAPEARRFGRPLLQLLYGKKPHIYRIICRIDEVDRTVVVLTIRHEAMEPVSMEEII